MLIKIADIFEVSVSELLGAKIGEKKEKNSSKRSKNGKIRGKKTN